MLQIIRLVVGSLQTNCYILYDIKTHDALIIDPGDDSDYIMRSLTDHELMPKAILATHGHFDHILVAGVLQDTYRIPFYVHGNDVFLIDRMNESAKFFLGYDIVEHKPRFISPINIGKTTIGAITFHTISTPGHTPGSISIFLSENKSIFVGDLVFKNGAVGRTDFLYSDKDKLKNSISEIFKCDGNTLLYPGHGDEVIISKERVFHKAL